MSDQDDIRGFIEIMTGDCNAAHPSGNVHIKMPRIVLRPIPKTKEEKKLHKVLFENDED